MGPMHLDCGLRIGQRAGHLLGGVSLGARAHGGEIGVSLVLAVAPGPLKYGNCRGEDWTEYG